MTYWRRCMTKMTKMRTAESAGRKRQCLLQATFKQESIPKVSAIGASFNFQLSTSTGTQHLTRNKIVSLVWSKRPFSARCENPGAHTPRKPFFTPGSQSYKSSFKEKAEERILYFHELDRESKVVQKKRFMLERISGKEKNRTLSRPQSADSWRRHHYQTRNKNKLKDLLSIRSIEVKAQPSRDLY